MAKKQNKAEQTQVVLGSFGKGGDSSLKSVAHAYMHLNGGPNGVAAQLTESYRDAPKGGMTRAKILDLVMNALRATDDKNPTKEDMQNLTDEDLLRTATELLQKPADAKPPGPSPTGSESDGPLSADGEG